MQHAASSTSTGTASVAWDGGELVITRDYAAPREMVFRAWTDEEHFARWYGPAGSSLPFCRLDPRPGGTLHWRHSFPDYEDVWVAGTYQEVAAPERLSYTVHFSDASGARVQRPGYPPEMLIDITFARTAEGTRVTIRHAGLPADHGEVQGWTESLDRLAALLAGDHTQPEV
ncbi:MAG TPA: SRPBCC domain-containing protein [Longimicrobium sp.]|nr:SRPBCC domain-containing protein [Longimicrobium sp.]